MMEASLGKLDENFRQAGTAKYDTKKIRKGASKLERYQHKERDAFNMRTKRFIHEVRDIPGPGAYNTKARSGYVIKDVPSISKTGFGAMASKQQRFHSLEEDVILGSVGPGEYNNSETNDRKTIDFNQTNSTSSFKPRSSANLALVSHQLHSLLPHTHISQHPTTTNTNVSTSFSSTSLSSPSAAALLSERSIVSFSHLSIPGPGDYHVNAPAPVRRSRSEYGKHIVQAISGAHRPLSSSSLSSASSSASTTSTHQPPLFVPSSSALSFPPSSLSSSSSSSSSLSSLVAMSTQHQQRIQQNEQNLLSTLRLSSTRKGKGKGKGKGSNDPLHINLIASLSSSSSSSSSLPSSSSSSSSPSDRSYPAYSRKIQLQTEKILQRLSEKPSSSSSSSSLSSFSSSSSSSSSVSSSSSAVSSTASTALLFSPDLNQSFLSTAERFKPTKPLTHVPPVGSYDPKVAHHADWLDHVESSQFKSKTLRPIPTSLSISSITSSSVSSSVSVSAAPSLSTLLSSSSSSSSLSSLTMGVPGPGDYDSYKTEQQLLHLKLPVSSSFFKASNQDRFGRPIQRTSRVIQMIPGPGQYQLSSETKEERRLDSMVQYGSPSLIKRQARKKGVGTVCAELERIHISGKAMSGGVGGSALVNAEKQKMFVAQKKQQQESTSSPSSSSSSLSTAMASFSLFDDNVSGGGVLLEQQQQPRKLGGPCKSQLAEAVKARNPRCLRSPSPPASPLPLLLFSLSSFLSFFLSSLHAIWKTICMFLFYFLPLICHDCYFISLRIHHALIVHICVFTSPLLSLSLSLSHTHIHTH